MVAPPSAPSVKNRLVRGFAWIMAARIVFNGLGFVSSIILARLLMPEDFGIVAVALGISAIVNSLTTLPIAEALIRTTDIEDDHLASALTLGLARSTLLAVLLAAAAWPTAYFYEDARLIWIMLMLAASTLATGFFSPRWPLIQKELSFGPTFVMQAASRLVSVIISILIAYYYHSYWAIIVPMAVTQVMIVAITHYYGPYPIKLSTRRIRDIWSFSIWMTFSTILNTVNARLDTLMIGAVLGHRAVGFYSYGDDKAALPSREMSAPMVQVLFPGLAAVKDDPARLASAYKRVQSLIFALCTPASIGLALVADQFVHVLLGDKWLPIVPVIQILAAALSLENLVVAAGPLAMAQGRTRELFHRDTVNFALRAPAIALGLIFYGLVGVLAARAASSVYGTWLYMRLVKKIAGVGVREQLLGAKRTFGALLIMTGGVIAFKASPALHGLPGTAALLLTVAAGGLLYAGGHALLWCLTGRPDGGPEAELLTILRDVLRKRAARRIAAG